MAKYNIQPCVYTNIYTFYSNVAKKYQNTFTYEDIERCVNNAYNSVYKIENGAIRRIPTLSCWKGYYMAHIGKWYFAYTINDDEKEGTIITVVDARHGQNMHEQRKHKIIKITETQFRDILKQITPTILYS